MEQIQNNLPDNFYDLPPKLRVQAWNRILSAINQNTREIKSIIAAQTDYSEFANLFAGNETDFRKIEVEIDFSSMRVELDFSGG